MAPDIKIKEKKIKVAKNWPDLQSIRDIWVFLGFANFYKRFIKNFNRIAASLISVFWTIDNSTSNEFQSTLTNASRNNQDRPGGISSKNVDRDIKNLLSVVKSTKSKKPNFVKASFAKMEFLIFEAKKAFIYLRKVFTKALILEYFDLKYYIYIKINILEYTINKFLNQMTLDYWD